MNALGVASLAFWALIVIICVKYICAGDAGRQPRRGRHPRPDRAGHAEEPGPARRAGAAGDARRVRHVPALRRRADHAGDLGAQRGRGLRGRVVGVRELRHPARLRDPGLPVPRAASGHRRHRQGLRAGDGRVVHRARRARAAPDRSPARRCSVPINPIHIVDFFAEHRARRSSRSAASSSSSPAARRCTPTWATSGGGRSPWPGTGSCCRACC